MSTNDRREGSPSALSFPVFELIRTERMNQIEKWGPQHHDAQTWLLILQEEIGEMSEAALKRDPVNYLLELTQVAAVAVAMLEDCVAHAGKDPRQS